LNDFSPASTSIQWMRRLPPYARSTAASNTGCEAAQMSGPVPSPSMKGRMGWSGNLESAVADLDALAARGGSGLPVGHGFVSG
jgi:hypothetical protein